eukprot:3722331-Prymnesium_polylepis.1
MTAHSRPSSPTRPRRACCRACARCCSVWPTAVRPFTLELTRLRAASSRPRSSSSSRAFVVRA